MPRHASSDQTGAEPLRSETPSPFDDADVVARYAQGPPRLVPGYADLHRMTGILLAEGAPEVARILVLGAGGGLELKYLAEWKPNWRFEGVDPAAPMLNLAKQMLGPLMSRVSLQLGTIDDASPGPFDGATCLLTLHFLPREERLHALKQIHLRLAAKRPLVVAHFSFAQEGGERALWLSRFAAFAIASGVAPEQARANAAAIDARVPILSPAEDEAILLDAGFSNISQFYAGLALRGWVAYA